jgi:hypothetical protein
MARGRGRSGFAWAGSLFGWGLKKGVGLGVGVAKSPFKLAHQSGKEVLAGGGNIAQQLVAIVVWAFYGLLALYLAALLRKTGIVVLAPVTWALVAAAAVFLATLFAHLKTKGIRAQARLRRALITIEANTAATRDKVEQLEAGRGGDGGGGWDISEAFKGWRRQREPTFDEQVRMEADAYAAEHATEDIPDWMRRMAGEKVRRWPWKRGPK